MRSCQGTVAAMALICMSACAQEPQPIELRVMTFNIEWGGTHVSFDNVIEVIRMSGADIVGIQEAEGNLPRLAAELGWQYDAQTYALSRYPILDAPNSNRRFVYIEVRPGQVVALANVHLPSDPAGTEFVRDGGSVDELIELEKEVRLEALVPYLRTLEPVVKNGVPVYLTGDFNAPSHADWTEEMVGARPFLKYSVDWPVSRATENTGFKDSWRAAHPDPRTAPGLTWWAGRPPLELYAPDENDPQDRIDFVWYAGEQEVLSSELIGEADAEDVTMSVSPWPSDHRAIVSTFSVTPVSMPRLIDVERRIYDEGDDITISYYRALDSQIDIVGHGSTTVSGDGQIHFPGTEFRRGHYTAIMHTPGNEKIASDFWVMDKAATPTISVSRDSYAVGETIEINWRDGPGHRNDYIGIYGVGVKPDYDPDYDGGLTWMYVNALPEGSVDLDEATSEVMWPIPPGTYVARLMKDDGYDVLAESATFFIR